MLQCLEIKNELVLAAIKVKTNQQVQDEEMKNLVFYREECEIAWKERKLSEERERDAMKIIEDLKNEIETLQGQVQALVATVLPRSEGHLYTAPHTSDSGRSGTTEHVRGLGSPTKTIVALKRQQQSAEPRVVHSSESPTRPRSYSHDILSFDEWKRANQVWDPHAATIVRHSTTPSVEALLEIQKQQEIARCVSVPSLQPTAMERAVTAVASLPLSPSPTRKNRKPQTAVGFMRATTSSPSKRGSPSLPRV